MKNPNEKTPPASDANIFEKQRVLIHKANLRGPTLSAAGQHASQILVGSEGVVEIELLEKRQVLKVTYEKGLVAGVPLSNVGMYFEANEAAQAKWKSHRDIIKPKPVEPVAPRPVIDDTQKL